MLSRNQRILLGAAASVVVAGTAWQSLKAPPPPLPSVKDVAPPELLAAIEKANQKPSQGPAVVTPAPVVERVETIIDLKGMNNLHLRVTNRTEAPFSIRYKAGDIFEGERAQAVVLLKSCEAEVPPGATEEKDLPVVAIKSGQAGDHGRFTSSSRKQPNLVPLIRHLESNPALAMGSVQAAVLAIMEDAPVDLFARFPRPKDLAGKAGENFKIDTVEIIAAIQLLREIGVDSCKLAADPQLKIEAMIDPQAHASAMKYYGIDPSSEWSYWRHELLEGDPATRHYALYGIARFYPDVALQMMPRWALEQRTAPHFRRAAIGALALTRRTEAGPLLRSLERDLAHESELAQKVDPALRYLAQTANDAP